MTQSSSSASIPTPFEGSARESRRSRSQAGDLPLEHTSHYQLQAQLARLNLSTHADDLQRGGEAPPFPKAGYAQSPWRNSESGPLSSLRRGRGINTSAFLSGYVPSYGSDRPASLLQTAAYTIDTSPDAATRPAGAPTFTPTERLAAGPILGDTTQLPPDTVRTADQPVKRIEVVYQNQSGNHADDVHPNYIVGQDGHVQTVQDAAQSTSDTIVIEVQRPAGYRGSPPAQQQQAIDQLVTALSDKFMIHQPEANGSPGLAGVIDDPQGLVSPQVRLTQRTLPTPEDQLPAETREQIQNTNRWQDAGTGPRGQGHFTNREAGEQFAPRTVPRQIHDVDPNDHSAHPEGETTAVAAMKDIVSGFVTRDSKDPYHAVKYWGGPEGARVGRYGTTAAQYRSWLAGLSDAQIKELIAEGKLSRGALDLAHFLKEHPDGADPNNELTGDAKGLNDFLNKLQKGDQNNGPTRLEIDKYFNPYLQEKMGSDLIRSYAHETADLNDKGQLMANIGKIALSMYLGHKVTDQEIADNPAYKAYYDAAMRQWPLAVEKEQGVGNIDLSNAAQKIAQLAKANQGRALWEGTGTGANLGCASSVWNLLRQAGYNYRADFVAANLGVDLQHYGWQKDSFDHRRPGDVVVCVSGPGGHGHIGVMADNDVTYSNSSGSGRWTPANAAQYWGHRSAGGRIGLYVLHPPGNQAA